MRICLQLFGQEVADERQDLKGVLWGFNRAKQGLGNLQHSLIDCGDILLRENSILFDRHENENLWGKALAWFGESP